MCETAQALEYVLYKDDGQSNRQSIRLPRSHLFYLIPLFWQFYLNFYIFIINNEGRDLLSSTHGTESLMRARHNGSRFCNARTGVVAYPWTH